MLDYLVCQETIPHVYSQTVYRPLYAGTLASMYAVNPTVKSKMRRHPSSWGIGEVSDILPMWGEIVVILPACMPSVLSDGFEGKYCFEGAVVVFVPSEARAKTAPKRQIFHSNTCTTLTNSG